MDPIEVADELAELELMLTAINWILDEILEDVGLPEDPRRAKRVNSLGALMSTASTNVQTRFAGLRKRIEGAASHDDSGNPRAGADGMAIQS